jgi:hypothetical protein
VSLFAAGRSKEARAFADNALRQSLPAEQEADVRLSLAAMFAISADDRADTPGRAVPHRSVADTRARLWASLFHNLMVASRLDEGLAIESEVRTSVLASTDLAAQYFFQIGRSAMEYQLGRFELSLRLLAGVDPGQLAGFDDPRERLTHSYRRGCCPPSTGSMRRWQSPRTDWPPPSAIGRTGPSTSSRRGKAGTCSTSAGSTRRMRCWKAGSTSPRHI